MNQRNTLGDAMTQSSQMPSWHGTTILSVRKDRSVVVAGDGQVSMQNMIIKSNARKVRPLVGGQVLAGFAGATADAMTLFERLEGKLEQYPGQLTRACVELAKDWRTDRYLRRLEAMMIVADRRVTLVLTGTGDVLEPEHGVVGIGSGGNFALAAARALIDGDLDAAEIARRAMAIAADICVFTNANLVLESLEAETG
jgi:ATP-dependent HslUV protease subunit HslV